MRILTTTWGVGGSINLRTITRFMKPDDNIQKVCYFALLGGVFAQTKMMTK